MRTLLTRSLVLLGASALVVSACGGDDESTSEPTGDSTAPVEAGALTVGGASFTESVIMIEIYRALLEDAGYDVTVQTVDNREIYEPALESGEIDVVPDYLATLTEFLNRAVNGPDAEPVASSDPQATLDELTRLGAEVGIVPLEPAQAANQNAFVVTEAFAAENGLTTLSDLGALGEPVVLAATEECPERPFCQIGLEDVYGITVERVEPLGFGSPQTKQAVADGTADLGLTGTTDGTLGQFGLVLLEDDQGLQLAENLVPVVNAEAAEDERLAAALAPLADVLTTEDLAALNLAVDDERQLPADVATEYLQEKGLIG